MPRNLEVKARVRSLPALLQTASRLGAQRIGTLHQRDTYFEIPSGRLKLRVIRGGRSELIYYERRTIGGTKGRWSAYLVYPVAEAKELIGRLMAEYPIRCVVEKSRILFLYRNARIHCDTVKGLGTFLEFEILEDHGHVQAVALLKALREHFNVKASDTVAGSYEDLMQMRLRRRR